MQDLDRHSFPPGGWQFRQPQTGWSAPNPISNTFDQQKINIIKHRSANPAICVRHKLSTDPATVGDELENFNRLRLGLPAKQVAPSFFHSSPSLSGRAAAVAVGIKRAAQGTAVALDWIQSGGDPVDQALAEKRAQTCVDCPKNVEGAWFTTGPAELLRSAVKGWQALKGKDFPFETAQGDKLKSCDVCKCLMRLKVFCPLDHILNKTKPEIMAELPPNCWIKKRDQ